MPMYLAGLGVGSLQFLHFEHDLATWGSLLACSDPYLNTSNIIIIYPQEKGKIIKRVQGTNKIKLNTKKYSSFIGSCYGALLIWRVQPFLVGTI